MGVLFIGLSDQSLHLVYQRPELSALALDSSRQRLTGLLPSALVGCEWFVADPVVNPDRSERLKVVAHVIS